MIRMAYDGVCLIIRSNQSRREHHQKQQCADREANTKKGRSVQLNTIVC